MPLGTGIFQATPRMLIPALRGALEFLLQDEFTTALSAGSVNGTAAEPGPGTRVVVDTGNVMQITGGDLSHTYTGLSDPSYWLDGVARQAGVALIGNVNWSLNTHRMYIGWDTNQVTDAPVENVWRNIAAAIRMNNMVCGVVVTAGRDYYFAVIMRSDGFFWCIKDGVDFPDWHLLFVSDNETNDPLYPVIQQSNAGGGTITNDFIRVMQLANPWDTDYGIATQRLAGARNPGDTFIHDGNCVIEFTVTTLPSAGQIELRFRAQDTNNYWQVTVDSAGNLDLDEVVGGAPTNRGSAAGVVSNGERMVIVADDQRIQVMDSTARYINYATAVNFETETDGELETEGTGGAVSDIVSYPVDLSGDALSELDKYTNL